MKKIVSLLVVFLLTAALWLSVGVAADNSVTKEGLYYEVVDGEVIITTAVKTISGDLVIPAEIDGKPVTAIRATAFFECVQLASVTIPDTVTTIGNNAFGGCIHLSKITIPASVTSIGMDVFHTTAYYNDDKNWDAGLLYVDGCLVASRAELTTAVLREDTRLIAGDVFFGSGIKAVSIPAGVTVVGARAFSECGSLTDVYYGGTEADWNKISVADGNTALANADKHYEKLLDKPNPEAEEKATKTVVSEKTKKTFNTVWLAVSIGSGVLAVACAVLMLVNKKKDLAQQEKEAAAEQPKKKTDKQPKPKKKSSKKK